MGYRQPLFLMHAWMTVERWKASMTTKLPQLEDMAPAPSKSLFWPSAPAPPRLPPSLSPPPCAGHHSALHSNQAALCHKRTSNYRPCPRLDCAPVLCLHLDNDSDRLCRGFGLLLLSLPSCHPCPTRLVGLLLSFSLFPSCWLPHLKLPTGRMPKGMPQRGDRANPPRNVYPV